MRAKVQIYVRSCSKSGGKRTSRKVRVVPTVRTSLRFCPAERVLWSA